VNNSNNPLAAAAEEHRVVLDRIGPDCRTRYCCATCMETNLIGSIVVYEPFMTSGVWQRRLVAFFEKHPCSKVVDEGYRE
jgi:hypothetical protein